ncbi:MAG: FecR domain-containing protein [Elusimicrobia bacterium]|nr:FecR domain-containing protein [Elusimicrobiota bacterium]
MNSFNMMLKKTLAAGLAALLAAPAMAAMPVASQIGVAAGVRGKVFAFAPAAQAQAKPVGREITSGKPLFLNEKVTTDEKGHMQIMLIDETTFTLGPKASMVLDEFVYDPATGAGKVSAQVTKGAFRFVTGHIGHKDPSSVKVKFPTGTMGIRGTIVAGNVGEDGSTTVVLLGPGAGNNAGERPGAFNLENSAGGVDVTNPGFGSTMGSESAPPTPPALIPAETMGAILGALAPPADQGAGEGGQAASGSGDGGGQASSGSGESSGTGDAASSDGTSSDGGAASGGDTASGGETAGETTGGGGDAAAGGTALGGDTGAGADATGGMFSSDMGGDYGAGGESISGMAGQDTAGASGDLAVTVDIAGVTDAAGSVTTTASSDNADETVAEENADKVVAGATTWEAVQSYGFGSGYYYGQEPFLLSQCGGAPCSNPQGYFLYYLAIDFGAKTFGGPDSMAFVNAYDDAVSITDSLSIPAQSYAGLTGPAVISQVSDSGFFTVDFTLENNSSAADAVSVLASYDDSSTIGEGAANALLAGQVTANPSDWASVQTVLSGKGRFTGSGSFTLTMCNTVPGDCASPSGLFSYLLEIDFGVGTVGGGDSFGSLIASDPGTNVYLSENMSIGSRIIAEQPAGTAAFSETSNNLTMDFTLLDYLGTADALSVTAAYDDNGTILGNGASTAQLQADAASLTGASDWASVGLVPGGTGRFVGGGPFTLTTCLGGDCLSPTGFFQYMLEIDFGAKTYGGANSGAFVDASDAVSGVMVNDFLSIGQTNFGSSGPASIPGVSDSGKFTVDMSLTDVNGVAGMGLDATASYTDGTDAIGSGAASSMFELDQPVSAGTPTTWDGLYAVQTGAGVYMGYAPFNLTQCVGAPGDCVNPSGQFSYLLKIDFGAKYIGGGGSGVTLNATADNIAPISVEWSYAGGNYGGGADPVVISGNNAGMSVDFSLKDVGGVTAAGLDVLVQYVDGSILGNGTSSAFIAPMAGTSSWETVPVRGAGYYTGGGPFNLTMCDSAPGDCVNPTGEFSYLVTVDFGAKSFGGGALDGVMFSASADNITPLAGNIDLSQSQPFPNNAGPATFSANNADFLWAQFTLKDVNSVAAGGLDVAVTYDNFTTIYGSGNSFSPKVAIDGLSLWDDLWAGLPALGGAGYYSGQGPVAFNVCQNGEFPGCSASAGQFEYLVYVDFMNHQFGGNGSMAVLTAADVGGTGYEIAAPMEIGQTGFGGNGPAVVTDYWDDNEVFSLDFSLKDVNGSSAMGLDANAYYTDSFWMNDVMYSVEGFGSSSAQGASASDWGSVLALDAAPVGTKGLFTGSAPFYLTMCGNGSCLNPTGTLSYGLYIDFANKTVGGPGSGVAFTASYEVAPQDLQGPANLGGQANAEEPQNQTVTVSRDIAIPETIYGGEAPLSGLAHPQPASSMDGFNVDFTLRDVSGLAGQAVGVTAWYNDGSTMGYGFDAADISAPRSIEGYDAVWDDARSIYYGTGMYAGTGPFTLTSCPGDGCVSPAGIFSYMVAIDFGERTYEAGAYIYAWDQAGDARVNDALAFSGAFGSGSTPASFSGSSGNGLTVDFSLKNVGDVAATGMEAQATYSNGDVAGGSDWILAPMGTSDALTPSTWDVSLAAETGAGAYAGAGVLDFSICHGAPGDCVNPSGVFSYLLTVDFGAKTFGGEGSGIDILASEDNWAHPITDRYDIPRTSFNGYAGAAGVSLNAAKYVGMRGGEIAANFTLQDVAGVAAAGADVTVGYSYSDPEANITASADGFSVAARAAMDATSTWESIAASVAGGLGIFKGGGPFTLAACNGGSCTAPTGSFEYLVYVDFANKVFGGNGSVATVSASDAATGVTVSDSLSIGAVAYIPLAPGSAMFLDQTNGSFSSPSNYFRVDFTLKDFNGDPAQGLWAEAFYESGYEDEELTWHTINAGFGSSYASRRAALAWNELPTEGAAGWYEGSGPLLLSMCGGSYCIAPQAGFHYGIKIDFANGQFGGPGSGAYVWGEDTPNNFSFTDNLDVAVAQDFADLPGYAADGPAHIQLASGGGEFKLDFTLRDVGGVSAGGAEVSATYEDGVMGTYGYGRAYALLGVEPTFVDGLATWADAGAIISGVGNYGGSAAFTLTACASGEGGACGAPSGFFTYLLNVDFGRKTYAGGAYVSAVDGPSETVVEDQVLIPPTSFAGLTGDAQFPAAVSDSSNLTANFELRNVAGVAAAGLGVSVEYDDHALTTGSGNDVSGQVSSLADSVWEDINGMPSAGVYAGGGPLTVTSCNGQTCVAPAGFFTYLINIDFEHMTVGGSGSGAYVSISDQNTQTNLSQQFYFPTAVLGSVGFSFNPGPLGMDFTLKDVDNGVATALFANATFDDGDTYAEGSGGAVFGGAALQPTWEDVATNANTLAGAGFYKGGGPFHLYDCGDGANCVNPTGSFDYLVYIDFTNHVFGGNGSMASFSASDATTGVDVADSVAIGQFPYGAPAPGPASFTNWTYMSDSWLFGIDFTLKNVNGDPAKLLWADAYYEGGYYDEWDTWVSVKGAGSSRAWRAGLPGWGDVGGLATFGGTGWYEGSGPLAAAWENGNYWVAPKGGFHYGLYIDFSNGTFGGNGSGAYVWGEDLAGGYSFSDSISMPAAVGFDDASNISYDASGPAHITAQSASGNFVIDFSLKDVSNGTDAAGLEASVSYYDGENYIYGYGRSSSSRIDYPGVGGEASWNDVRTIISGSAHFGGSAPFALSSCAGGLAGACANPQGFFSYMLNVDFGKQIYDGGAYVVAYDPAVQVGEVVTLGTNVRDSLYIPPTSFAGMAGEAIIPTATSESGNFSIDFGLHNVGGLAAAGVDAAAYYEEEVDGNYTIGSGSALGRPRAGLDVSQWEDILLMPQSGGGLFAGRGVFGLGLCNWNTCASPTGFFEYAVFVDFSLGEYGGNGSFAMFRAANPESEFVPAVDIAGYVAIPSGQLFGVAGDASLGSFTDNAGFTIDFSLKDAEGDPAMALDAVASYQDEGAGTFGAGWSSDPRGTVPSWSDMRDLASNPEYGTGWFSGEMPFNLVRCAGSACVFPQASFRYGLFVDFANKLIGGNGSGVRAEGVWGYGAGQFSVSASVGQVTYDSAETYPDAEPAHVSATDGNGFDVDFSLKNVQSLASLGAEVQARYMGADGTVGFGQSSSGLRVVEDGVSSWDELRAIPAGAGTYEAFGTPFAFTRLNSQDDTREGAFDFTLGVDFGARTYYLNSTLYDPDTAAIASIGVSDVAFDKLTGLATISQSNAGYSLDMTLNNVGGVPGATADAAAAYHVVDGGDPNIIVADGAGSVAGVPLCPGPACP